MFINSKPQKLFKPYVFNSGGLQLLTKVIFLKFFLTQWVNYKQFYTKNLGVNIEKKTDFTAILAAIFTCFFSKTLKNM